MEIESQKAMKSLTYLESNIFKFIIAFFCRGGCALVWLAKDHQTGETVALKQFPKHSSGGVKGIDSTA